MASSSQHEQGPQRGLSEAEARAAAEADTDLMRMLADAEFTVDRLKQEVERRRRDHQQLQQEEAARLAEHLEQAQVNWQQVRAFFESALSEYRSGSSWENQPPRSADSPNTPE